MKKIKIQTNDLIDHLRFGMLLAMAGGFMDAYSYTVHGNVFATGQTGNFVLIAVRLAEGNYTKMFQALVPIVFFWIGTFTGLHLLYTLFEGKKLLWEHTVLIFEMLILFVTGFLPSFVPNVIANALVSFAAALQFCAFRKFRKTEAYASVFCTGNMRSCAENYYKGLVMKDKKCMKKAYYYTCILISFFLGALICAASAGVFHNKAIWIVCVILIVIIALSYTPSSIREMSSDEMDE